MAQYDLDITVLYANGEVLYAAHLDAVVNDVEVWANRTKLNLNQLALDVFGTGYSFDNDGLANYSPSLSALIATLSEDETVTGDWTFNGSNTLTISQDWTAAGETCADLGTVTTADFTDIAVTTTATFAGATIADLGTVTTADFTDIAVTTTATFAGATIADLGTVTTADFADIAVTTTATFAGATIADLGTVTTADFTDIAVTTTATFAGATIADLGTVTTADIDAGSFDNSTSFTYAAGQTRYYSVDNSAFIDSVGSLTNHRNILGGDLQNTNAGFSAEAYYAPVNLPHGAIVTSFKIWYDRDDAASTLTASLLVKPLATKTGAFMATITAGDSSGAIVTEEDTTIASATIDNSANSYYCTVAIDNNNATSDILFVGIVITYTVTDPLP
jgi:hypothetical protein